MATNRRRPLQMRRSSAPLSPPGKRPAARHPGYSWDYSLQSRSRNITSLGLWPGADPCDSASKKNRSDGAILRYVSRLMISLPHEETTMRLCVALLAVFCFTTVAAGTPDGSTPAEETICDPLKNDGYRRDYTVCASLFAKHKISQT